jgi:hypothetical protein
MLAERLIQRAVFTHLRTRPAPGVVAWHTPNGGYRHKSEAAIFNGLGVLAGIPDVIAIRAGNVYALELKAERGKLSPAQMSTIDALSAAGVTCAVAYGVDAAIEQLEAWGLLRCNKFVVSASPPVRCIA